MAKGAVGRAEQLQCLLRPWPHMPALAGGHSDGDEVFATLNHDIVEFLEHTEAAVRALDFATAAIRAPATSGIAIGLAVGL